MPTNTIDHQPAPTAHVHAEDDFDAFVLRINERFNALTGPIFETDATGLYEAYLSGFPEGTARQYHSCNCCKQFIERFGSLAVVEDTGMLVSAIWDGVNVPDHYKVAIAKMAHTVRRAKLTKPFLSAERQYGQFASGANGDGNLWTHFAIKPAAARVYRGPATVTAFAAASLKREELGSVLQAMSEYSKETCDTALRLLKNDQLGNSDAVLGQAQFLVDLHAITAPNALGRNLVARAVAAAPSGFCHPRASMIATLLDDIQAGKTFEQAQARWNAKMHPLAYQRPTAAPSAGAIKAAEEAFVKLGAASALRRRYATTADIQELLWAAAPPDMTAQPAGGIFSSVKAKGVDAKPMSMRAPAITITWDKFARTVLVDADKIELWADHNLMNLVTFTAAADPDSVPMLQWDSADRRNTVSFFGYSSMHEAGSQPHSFDLQASKFYEITGITPHPHQWRGGVFEHQGAGVILLIDGARDTRHASKQSAIFPSNLRAEYHGMRQVIERFSAANTLEGFDGEHLCGLCITSGFKGGRHTLLRVTTGGVATEYKIDRWD